MPILQRFSTPRFLRSAAPALLLLGFAGCKDEGVKTLFDEGGVWAVIQFDLQDTGLNDVSDNRKSGFMLNFHKKEGVVEAASCQDDSGSTSINSSLCHSDPNAVYVCNCFAYEFEESIMTWVEYDAGSSIPDIPDDPGGGGGGGSGSGTGGGGADGVTQILAGEVEGVASNKSLSPLPVGLFGSRADIDSRFVIQQKSPVIWDNPPENNPSEPPNCGCI